MSDVEIMKVTGHINASTLVPYSHHRASDVAAKLDQKRSDPRPDLTRPRKRAARS